MLSLGLDSIPIIVISHSLGKLPQSRHLVVILHMSHGQRCSPMERLQVRFLHQLLGIWMIVGKVDYSNSQSKLSSWNLV